MKVALNILVMFCMAMALNASAKIFVSIDGVETPTSGRYIYSFTIHSWDLSDPTPNPCYGDTSCTIMINHRHEADGSGGEAQTSWWGGCVATSKTIGSLGSCLSKQDSGISPTIRLVLPYSSTTTHTGKLKTEECIGIFWGADHKYGGTLLPGSVCAIVPPPVGKCGFEGNVDIDYGSIGASQIDGLKKDKDLTVTCTDKMNAKIYMVDVDNGKLQLAANLYSQISLDDHELDNNGLAYSLKKGDNVINLQSKLVYSGGTLPNKELSKSGILVLSLD